MAQLAVEGGQPVRSALLPYGRQQIDEADIEAVVQILQSDWLTTGPKVAEFEQDFALETNATYAVALNSGTAALHAAMQALNIGLGDEVIVSPLTFAASANCVLYQGGTPVFSDIEPDTLLLDASKIEPNITPRTKAIIPVDYAGQPCDYSALRVVADKYNLAIVADGCHALGASYQNQKVGAIADLTAFSLHPVKHITTGEGGMITTNNQKWAETMRHFRTHGITTDHRQRAEQGAWFYEMAHLGYNYRLPDINCALGQSQLKKLNPWVARRQEIAEQYDRAFAHLATVSPTIIRENRTSAWHIYPILLNLQLLKTNRKDVFSALRAENIGVNVHYIPVYWHPYYAQLGYHRGLCPAAEDAYERLITLPIFPSMSAQDVQDVVTAVYKVMEAYSK